MEPYFDADLAPERMSIADICLLRLDDIKENSEEDLITWYANLGNGSYR